MRDLKGDDLFALLTIVGKLDIKDELVKMFEKNSQAAQTGDHQKKTPTKSELEKQESETEQRGMVLMASLMQNVLINSGNVKKDINVFFADLTNRSLKEIEGLSLKDYTALIVGFFKKPELADFFSSIASLTV